MKTDQERIDDLANSIRDFKIEVSGGGIISGGFGELPQEGQITLAHLEKSFSEFRLIGDNGVTTHGSLAQGYAIHAPVVDTEGPTGFPQPIFPPPIILTGACCAVDGSCSITTFLDCPGDYRGDNTLCFPNPCPVSHIGACCADDSSCSITTEADCVGIYQGDNTLCSIDLCGSGACGQSVVHNPDPASRVCTCMQTIQSDCAPEDGFAWNGYGSTCDSLGFDACWGACCDKYFCERRSAYDCDTLVERCGSCNEGRGFDLGQGCDHCPDWPTNPNCNPCEGGGLFGVRTCCDPVFGCFDTYDCATDCDPFGGFCLATDGTQACCPDCGCES